jgi:hypothetical protein
MQTADFYSSATGTLRVNGGRDENAPKGVSLSVDDLSYIKQGSRANDAESVTDYDLLDNKPQINNITLTGNKSLNDLGIQSKIDSSHKVSADNIDDTNTTNKFATAVQLAQIQTNETNILLIESMNGAKNEFYFDTVTDSTGMTHTINGNAITVAGVQTYGYVSIEFTPKTNGEYTISFNVSGLSTNKGYILVYDLTTSTKIGETSITSTGTKTIQINISDISHTHAMRLYTNYSGSTMESASMTVDDIMIYRKSIYDAGFTDYQPYAMSNAELTAAIQALQAQLANQ